MARVSGSEEECGRETKSSYNIIDLLQGWESHLAVGLLSFRVSNITARIPLQSKIGSEEPIFDSFPPGEAFWWKIWRFTKESLPLLRQAFVYALGWVGSVGSVGAGEGVGAEVSGGSVGLGSTRAMILSRVL